MKEEGKQRHLLTVVDCDSLEVSEHLVEHRLVDSVGRQHLKGGWESRWFLGTSLQDDDDRPLGKARYAFHGVSQDAIALATDPFERAELHHVFDWEGSQVSDFRLPDIVGGCGRFSFESLDGICTLVTAGKNRDSSV